MHLDNCKHPFWGASITKQMYIDALKSNIIQFSMRRSSMDSLYNKDATKEWMPEIGEHNTEGYRLRPQYTEILTQGGYTLKSPEEFIVYYYED